MRMSSIGEKLRTNHHPIFFIRKILYDDKLAQKVGGKGNIV